jgi:predicted phosphodiesterase
VAHGALDDAEHYVDSRAAAAEQLARLEEQEPGARVLVLGHTHRQWAYTAALGPRSTRAPVPLPAAEPILLNPGAVGQSRDLRARARCLLLDLERRHATFLSVRYDLASCRAALRGAGLPERSVHLRPSALRVTARALRKRVR